MRYDQESAMEFAKKIKEWGFRVWLAEKGTYGFISDESGKRVLSFSFTDGGSLGGNYWPHSHESGTGWRMDKSTWELRTPEDVIEALNAYPPEFCGKGWKTFTTVEQHLSMYGASSRYREI